MDKFDGVLIAMILISLFTLTLINSSRNSDLTERVKILEAKAGIPIIADIKLKEIK